MATVKEVIDKFVDTAFKGEEAFVSGKSVKTPKASLYFTYNKLYTYNTCLAEVMFSKARRAFGADVMLNITSYSPTSSRHRNYLKAALQKRRLTYLEVDKVPRNMISITAAIDSHKAEPGRARGYKYYED